VIHSKNSQDTVCGIITKFQIKALATM